MVTGERSSVTLTDIQAASRNLQGVTIHTPLLPAEQLSQDIGARVFYKAENTQRAGSFKLRGAYNKIASLSLEERRKGVIAHSAGNHAQGVALAAQIWNVPATVVMPRFAPLAKVKATQRLGAEVILHGDSFDDAGAYAHQLQQEYGSTYVHAFNDPLTIAGQGTVGLELAKDLPSVETVVVPVGGGGLIAGIAVALRGLRRKVRIVGVQAEGCPSLRLSLSAGEPVTVPRAATISDGIAVKRPGDLTLPIIRQMVDEVVTVDDEETARAIFHILQYSRLVVEGAGAVGVAALLSGKITINPGETVAVILSGGNIDANFLARIIEQVLVKQGRYLLIRTSVPDKPGNLAPLLVHTAESGANVIDVQHRRAAWQLPLDRVGIEMILEVRDEEHGQHVIDHLERCGYHVERFGQRVWPI
ncbi:MAG: threonine ammonia-lyase [Herpetosiphonaceae bacterium]|nr:MAG: threonine ammonia-lyase [Herpetosiphonaceae bacterium]